MYLPLKWVGFTVRVICVALLTKQPFAAETNDPM